MDSNYQTKMMKTSFLGKIMDNLRSFFKRIFSNESNKSSQLPTLKIAMLGPTAVGKTSLLAAMYDQFENISRNLEIKPHKDTKSILEKRLEELKSFVEEDTIKIGKGVRPDIKSIGVRSLMFDFGEIGAPPALSLEFQDYPGEFINNGDPKYLETVKSLIQSSVAIIIPIDTAALMERDGKYHEYLNQTQKVYDLCRYFYEDLQSPKLIIFAPIKCESYIHDPKKLIYRVKEGYAKLFNKLSNDKLLTKIAVVITPVQTVGSAYFSRIEYNRVNEDEANEPVTRFRKQDSTDIYKPKYSEQPLRYLFRFLINLHMKQKQEKRWNLPGISLFNRDSSLKDAIKEFAYTTSISDVSIVVQGSNLLEL
jgi:hypothetical protein